MIMKKLFILSAALCLAGVLAAEPQTARKDILQSMQGVEVVQDSLVGVLLRNASAGEQKLVEIEGYRVQVYSSNQQQTAKGQALKLENKLKGQLDQPVYVQYLPPFWKVRVGNFRTVEEAKEYKQEFVQLYPELQGDTYIVRDKIHVFE